MVRKKHHSTEETFLPQRIARAAEAAADEVLVEDRLLRQYGIVPSAGRSR